MNEPQLSGLTRRPPVRSGRGGLWVQILAAVAIFVVLGAGLAYCAKSGGGAGPGGRGGPGGKGGAASVGVARAVQGSIPIQISALGTVTSLATVNVNARVAGQLDAVAFREGQTVSKGQLLAQIDPRPFQVALQQAQAQLMHDQALLRAAQVDLTRYQTLKAQDSIAGQTVDTQAALVRQDSATVAADQANVANARLNLSFTHITSPISGKVGLRQIDPGNQITANGATPITVVTQVDPITVVFSLPELDIPAVAHQGVNGLQVTAYDRAGGTVLAVGRLASLDNIIDTSTGTVKAKAQFANPGGALYPNQFVNVTLLVQTLANQVIVPTTAIRHGPQGDYVWRIGAGMKVASTPVKVGPGAAETVSVLTGLQPGDTVVTDGGDKLKDGAIVRLPRAQTGAGGARAHHPVRARLPPARTLMAAGLAAGAITMLQAPRRRRTGDSRADVPPTRF